MLPADPGADRVGGLPVGQPLHELQQRCEREADRRLGELPPGKIARATSAVWSGTLYVRFASNDMTRPRLA